MVALFISLTKNLSIRELHNLTKCGKGASGVYVWCPESRHAYVPACGQLCWMVEYLLAHHHKKHVFAFRRPPRMSEIGKALSNWGHKVRWRYTLKDVDSGNWSFIKSKATWVRPCTAEIPCAIEAYIKDVQTNVFEACRSNRYRRLGTSNMSGIVRHALVKLKCGPWAAIPTDKDGGFALVKKQTLADFALSCMNSDCYQEVVWNDDSTFHFLEYYSHVAAECGRIFDDNSLTKALLSGLAAGHGFRLCSTIGFRVKTHKPSGQVGLRLLHQSSRHPMAPAMRLLSSFLTPILRSFPHILKDSEHFLVQLSTVHVPDGYKIVKFDIKDFFMSGLHADLLNETTSLVPEGAKRDVFRALLDEVLRSQHVRLVNHNNAAWRVMVGSGMGIVCSGEVSDAAFLKMAEIGFILDPSTRTKYSILHYSRFKDDGLIILGGSSASRLEFMREFKRRSRFFKIVVESISETCATMLDVSLFKGKRWKFTGILDHTIHYKDTSQWLPLSAQSAHPNNVHSSWPRMQWKRIGRRCSSAIAGAKHQDAFAQKLKKSGIIINFSCGHLDRPYHSNHKKPGCSRIILPFRLQWSFARLSTVISRTDARHRPILSSPDFPVASTVVSWKLGGTHLVQLMKSYCSQEHEHSSSYRILDA